MINNVDSCSGLKKSSIVSSSLSSSKFITTIDGSNTKNEFDSYRIEYFKERNVSSEYKGANWVANQEASKNEYLCSKNCPEDCSEQENDECFNNTIRPNEYALYSTVNNNSIRINNNIDKTKSKASNYYSNGNGGAIKRGCDDVEGETEDDLITLSTSSNSFSRRSPPKKPKNVVTSEEMNQFFKLLHTNEIQNFLKRDACCLISDKYALAMVFTYFKRANFDLKEYTLEHFFLALYLASDIEEDVDEYKYEIFPWALGNTWRSNFSSFLRKRDELLRRIGYRAIVSRKCCEEVMSLKSEHVAWKRERDEDHGGATRTYLINRSKRFLSMKNNLDVEDLNLPRLPEEAPRPCPLCLINRGWNPNNSSINNSTTSVTITASNNTSKNLTILNDNQSDFENKENEIESKNEITQKKDENSCLRESLSRDAKKKANEKISLIRKQKPLSNIINITNNENSMKKESSSRNKQNLVSVGAEFNHENLKLVKTPKKSVSKTILKLKKPKEILNTESDNEYSAKTNYDWKYLDDNFNSRIPASNKFSKNKLSTTDLENNHRGIYSPQSSKLTGNSPLIRHSSLVLIDKFLIEDQTSTSDEDDDEDQDYGDDVFSNNNEKSTVSFKGQQLQRKQDLFKSNIKRVSKNYQASSNNSSVKRMNHSLSSNSTNYSLKAMTSTNQIKNSKSNLNIIN